MQDDSALGRATAMVADLRQRCDWDRIQTRQTLRPYLIEEVHELDAAIAANDAGAIRDEVGDLMLHLAWQLVLGAEAGEFTASDIADDLVAKMRRRHPHLFDLGPADAWQALKRRERSAGTGTLDGLPATLPALALAYRLQERAAGVGFDWPDTDGPADKVREELAEVEVELKSQTPNGVDARAEEIGDLLFAVVNLARKAHVHPDAALERANRKFQRRFEQVEQLAATRGIEMSGAGLDVLDQLWDEVKRQ
ncbi:MAG TPA: nucleoside triphosphate pyrophosphohydrolase [Gemmatimonadales bacterium]